jgi:sugar O-acyltransferase (sialic acid O-acetyltransferase NeuD family)
MNKGLCIFGAGGFAREVFYLALQCGFAKDQIDFCDLHEGELLGRPVITEEAYYGWDNAVIAVGDPKTRKKIANRVQDRHGDVWTSLVAPSANIMDKKGVQVGQGSIICANSVLTCALTIGKHCHLNLGTTLGHDCRLGDFFTSAPGVHLSGNVKAGSRVYLGTGSCTVEGVSICDDVIIGAGAVVARDIVEPGTYVGVPAKKLVKKA